MGVEQVYVGEEGSPGAPGLPVEKGGRHIRGVASIEELVISDDPAEPGCAGNRASDAGAQDHLAEIDREVVIVDEAAPQPARPGGEQQISDEPCGHVSPGGQVLRERRVFGIERDSEIRGELDGKPTREEARVRREGPRGGCDGLLKRHGPPGKGVKRRRGRECGIAQTGALFPYRIEDQEQHVEGTRWRPGKGGDGGRFAPGFAHPPPDTPIADHEGHDRRGRRHENVEPSRPRMIGESVRLDPNSRGEEQHRPAMQSLEVIPHRRAQEARENPHRNRRARSRAPDDPDHHDARQSGQGVQDVGDRCHPGKIATQPHLHAVVQRELNGYHFRQPTDQAEPYGEKQELEQSRPPDAARGARGGFLGYAGLGHQVSHSAGGNITRAPSRWR
jgi:hypothetical protein